MTALGDIITAAATRYGLDPAVMLREAQIESGMNPSATNPSGAAGLFQFIPSTAAHYGLSNPLDPVASSDAAARLMRDNAAVLSRALGRDPTGAELYLAHQQGAGGAAKLLSHPDVPAASVVGIRAVTGNGGSPDMLSNQFSQLWANRYNATNPGQPGVPLPPQRPTTLAEALPGQPTPNVSGMVMSQPSDAMRALALSNVQNAGLGSLYAQGLDMANQQQQKQAADQARRQALFASTNML